MQTPFPTHPALECWRWLALQIACGLQPEQPDLLDRYRQAGDQLLEMGLIDAQALAEQQLEVLYRSACNVLLPWHWRCQCMNRLCLPMEALGRLAAHDPSLQPRLSALRLRLARTEMQPSEPPAPF